MDLMEALQEPCLPRVFVAQIGEMC
jgi:hypothetical protein